MFVVAEEYRDLVLPGRVEEQLYVWDYSFCSFAPKLAMDKII
jgi:hypothetical protein